MRPRKRNSGSGSIILWFKAGERAMKLRIAGVEKDSVVDGAGIRYVIFAQGCPHRCPGCHNPQTHDPSGGELVALDTLLADICRQKHIKGVTFSGGEPFLQAQALASLGRELKHKGYDIVTYTGYLFEDLLDLSRSRPDILALLKVTDWLIDGPFILEQKTFNLPYRGSANQRVIDLRQFE